MEIGYRLAVSARNGLYDAGILRTHDLGRPTISVGNLTTGGTGKTPLVAMLAAELANRGHRPAVLMRGYRRTACGFSDEAELLKSSGAIVEVDPDRWRGDGGALAAYPEVNLFILDDGMQYRRARDMEIVVIDATEPFGFGHLLPRGMLRKSPAGLRCADTVVITRAGSIAGDQRDRLIVRIKKLSPGSTVYCCDHVIERVWADGVRGQPVNCATAVHIGVRDRPPGGFCGGYANGGGRVPAATRFFPDHYDFKDADVIQRCQRWRCDLEPPWWS